MAAEKIVFSGIQPTGTIHIGNYFGAIAHWVAGQEDAKNLFCLVDMHALTVPQDPAILAEQILESATVLLACGIDPRRSELFVQSDVGSHGELTWYLSCLASMGQLNRMTQFKDKSKGQQGEARVGLFTYPILMASDILLYRTTHVPVGDDQRQHIELARDIAQRFNASYAPVFVVPQAAIAKTGARIMGLDDPAQKMSKTGTGRHHSIKVTDSPDVIRAAIMAAKTDAGGAIVLSPEKPGVSNLLQIFMAASGQSQQQVEDHFATARGYGDLKKELAELLVETLRPIRERYDELLGEPSAVRAILRASAAAVAPAAGATLQSVRRAMGVGA